MQSLPNAPGHAPSAPLRILIVDDDRSLETIYRNLLASHQIDFSYSIREALGFLETHQNFDVLLLDILLPDGTGFALYETILKRWPTLRPRIAFVTGSVPTREIGEFLTTVENPLLFKPFSGDSLRATVDQLAYGGERSPVTAICEDGGERPFSATPRTLVRQVALGLLVPGFLHRINNTLTGSICHLQLALEDDPNGKHLSEAGERLKKTVGVIGIVEDIIRLRGDEDCNFDLPDLCERILRAIPFLTKFRIAKIALELKTKAAAVWGNPGTFASLVLLLLADSEISPAGKPFEVTLRLTQENDGYQVSISSVALGFRDPQQVDRTLAGALSADAFQRAVASFPNLRLRFSEPLANRISREVSFLFSKKAGGAS